MKVPDVFRAARFLEDLEQFEAKGEFPNLVIICLPNNHTSGTKAACRHRRRTWRTMMWPLDA